MKASLYARYLISFSGEVDLRQRRSKEWKPEVNRKKIEWAWQTSELAELNLDTDSTNEGNKVTGGKSKQKRNPSTMNAMNILAVCVTQAEILGSYTSLLRCYFGTPGRGTRNLSDFRKQTLKKIPNPIMLKGKEL